MFGHCLRLLGPLISVLLLLPLLLANVKAKADCNCRVPETQPNIVLIMCDDVGWDDFSLHGSDQIPTPNIDALLASGVNLNRYYTAPMCTPARSSLMTGKYASRVGMQHYVIPNDQPYGLGLEHKLLPQYLQELGYRTHLVGKWHLGFFEERYTALHRGFDSTFGYNGGMIDFYKHESDSIGNPWHFLKGYDMRRNGTLAYDTLGRYATDLFTDEAVRTIREHRRAEPMFLYVAHLAAHAGNEDLSNQAPEEEISKFGHIANEKRRAYAAVMSKLDASVGRIVQALSDAGMLENCVIAFMSDNGAPCKGELANYGSNYPLRGQKDSPWEGGSKVLAGLWSSHLCARQRVSNELFHISDWMPTLIHLAGGCVTDPTVDGVNQWPSLCSGRRSPREEVLVNLDQLSPYRSFIVGDWKLVNGSSLKGLYDTWLGWSNDRTEAHPALRRRHFDNGQQCGVESGYGPTIAASQVAGILNRHPGRLGRLTAAAAERLRGQSQWTCNNVPLVKCDTQKAPCLFNIVQDPCERFNLAKVYPEVVQFMGERLEYFESVAELPRNRPDDRRSDPRYSNETWTWWFDALGLNRDPHALTELYQLDDAVDAMYENLDNALDTLRVATQAMGRDEL